MKGPIDSLNRINDSWKSLMVPLRFVSEVIITTFNEYLKVIRRYLKTEQNVREKRG